MRLDLVVDNKPGQFRRCAVIAGNDFYLLHHALIPLMVHSSGSEVALPGAVNQRQILGGMGFKILFFYLQHDFLGNAGAAENPPVVTVASFLISPTAASTVRTLFFLRLGFN